MLVLFPIIVLHLSLPGQSIKPSRRSRQITRENKTPDGEGINSNQKGPTSKWPVLDGGDSEIPLASQALGCLHIRIPWAARRCFSFRANFSIGIEMVIKVCSILFIITPNYFHLFTSQIVQHVAIKLAFYLTNSWRIVLERPGLIPLPTTCRMTIWAKLQIISNTARYRQVMLHTNTWGVYGVRCGLLNCEYFIFLSSNKFRKVKITICIEHEAFVHFV